MMNTLSRAYFLLVAGGNWLQAIVLLVFRLNWGLQFFMTGQGKLKNHEQVAKFFASLNIPMPDLNAWFIGGVETVGGALLILGLASRPVGLLLTVTMIGAYLAVEEDRLKVLNIFKEPEKFLQADPFFFMLTAILVLAFGAGILSVDAILARTVFSKYNVR